MRFSSLDVQTHMKSATYIHRYFLLAQAIRFAFGMVICSLIFLVFLSPMRVPSQMHEYNLGHV